jgi:hypothetical protein
MRDAISSAKAQHAPTPLSFQLSRRQVLSSSRADGNGLFLYFGTQVPPAIGMRVALKLAITDMSEVMNLDGVVHAHRNIHPLQQQKNGGFELMFEGEAKRQVARMLARCAGKAEQLGTARNARVDSKLGCSIFLGARMLDGQLRDLSSGGAFVAAPQISKLRIGCEVTLKIRSGLFGLSAHKLRARVVWFGSKAGSVGFGARFLDAPAVVDTLLRKHLP